MRKIRIFGVSLFLALATSSVYAADQGSFAVLKGAQAKPLSDSTLSSTFGKHFTLNLPNGTSIHASGTNSVAFGHATLTLGGGAASLSGLPCAVCDH